MAGYTAYDYKVYTRQLTSDAWTEQTEVLCARCEVHAGRKMGEAVLERWYGPDDAADRDPLELMDYWVRVAVCLPGGEEDVFYGVIVEQRLEEAARRQRWVAHDLKELLQRVEIVMLMGEYLQGLSAVPVRPCVFNRNIAAPAKAVGLRSTYRYHFANPVRGDRYDTGDESDVAYALGGASSWDAYSILEHLVRVYCPRADVAPSRFCPIGFDVEEPVWTGLLERLSQNEGEYNFFGRTLLEAIDTLVRDSGDLSWRIDWSDDGVHGYTFPLIRIFRCDYDVAAGEGDEIATADVLPVVIEDDGYNRATEVWAFGGPCRFMFTCRYGTSPGFSKGWSSELETAWAAFQPEYLRFSLERFGAVYREFVFSFGEDWGNVLMGPDLDNYASEPGDMVATDTAWLMDWYNHPRPFLPRNIVRAGTTYTSQDDTAGTALTQTASGDDVHGLEPLRGWVVPNEETDGVGYLRLSPLDGQGGVRVLDHPADAALDQDSRWQRLVVTGTVEGDWLLLSKAIDETANTGLVNIKFVFEPAYEWWVACPNTIISLDADAQWSHITADPPTHCTTVYGVVRNDYPKLKQLAENTLIKFNSVKKAVRFQFKTVTTAWELGAFVTEYNGHEIYAPVMSVVHRLSDDERYGTQIQTLFTME